MTLLVGGQNGKMTVDGYFISVKTINTFSFDLEI